MNEIIDKDVKKQEAEFAIRQKEQMQRAKIDGLLRTYYDVKPMLEGDTTVLAVNIRNMMIGKLSDMIIIVEKNDWVGVHPHDTFPKIDIRQLAYGCPVLVECPFLLAILKKIGMQWSDYVDYKKRMGMMIDMEHKRKMGKRK